MSEIEPNESLREALRHGNLKAVENLLNQIDRVEENDGVPLLILVSSKNDSKYVKIVKLLVEKGACVNVRNKNSPIAPLDAAVARGSEGATSILLDAGAVSSNHQKLLKQATKEGHGGCLRLLLKSGGDLSGHVGNDEEEETTLADLIFEYVDRPVDLILDVLDDRLVKVEDEDQKIKYRAQFDILAPQSCHRQMSVISSILSAASDDEKKPIVHHPLIELYLTLKWSRICYFFYLWIAGYVVFTLSMSVYITIITRNYRGLEGLSTATRCILIVTASLLLGHAILQCLLTRRNRWRKYEMWLNLCCTSLALIVGIFEHHRNLSDMPNWFLHVTSIAVLLAWMELMLLIGRLPTYGYYALMFSAVLQNVIKVLSAFMCLVVGFALSFSIQFRNFEQFADPWRALVKTTVMMMGEFEYADLFADKDKTSDPPTSRVIFLMFIILTSIVLMNLMIGLAVSDIQSLQVESKSRRLEKQAEFLAHFEKVMNPTKLAAKILPLWIRNFLRERCNIGTSYEVRTCPKFKRSGALPSELIDALLAKARARKVGADWHQKRDHHYCNGLMESWERIVQSGMHQEEEEV